MKFNNKTLSDFEKIENLNIDDIKIDNTLYESLNTILKRLARSEQKAAQIMELIKSEVSEGINKNTDLIDDVRQEKNQVKKDINILEKGIIEYFDILDAMQKAAEDMSDRKFLDAVNVAIKARKQISEGLGIQTVPVEYGQIIDAEYHYVVDSVQVDNKKLSSTVNKVIQNGYRRGDKLLRKASVITNRFQGEE